MNAKHIPRLAVLSFGLLTASQAPEHRPRERGPEQRYSIEQACSDRAPLCTIAFSGRAFLAGDFGASTFLPPGKVCDFFGFQYRRDIDAAQNGHNPLFLNRVVGNVRHVLNDAQRAHIPARSGVTPPHSLAELPLKETTIADFMKSANYAIAHLGKWHVGRVSPTRHGFDERDGANGNGGPDNVENPNPKPAPLITENGIAFMARQAKAGQPSDLQLSHCGRHCDATTFGAVDATLGTLRRPREEFVVHFPHYDKDSIGPAAVIYVSNFKLIRVDETGALHRCDIAKDMRERDDSAKQMPAEVAGLNRRLDECLKSVNAQLPTRNPNYDPSKPSENLLCEGKHKKGHP